MATLRDPFSDAFREPKLMQNFRTNKSIRKHMEDEDFCNTIEKLHKAAKKLPADVSHIDWVAMGQRTATEAYADPRVMQAVMTLYGNAPKFVEDLDAADVEPLQTQHFEAVEEIESSDDGKAKGNEYFKQGDLPMALAHYQRAITIERMKDPLQVAVLATLASNASMCLLKLNLPDRAKTMLTQATRALDKAGDTSFDQTKLLYRRALACEGIGDCSMAVDDVKRAFKEAQRVGQSASEQQRLRNELKRVQKLHEQQVEDAKNGDLQRTYWLVKNPAEPRDALAMYEEGQKWSKGPAPDRFGADGKAASEEGRNYADAPFEEEARTPACEEAVSKETPKNRIIAD